MSDNFSLIIKNGNCYIQGKFQKIDLGLSGNKISKIGKLDNSNTKSIVSLVSKPFVRVVFSNS